MNDSTSEKLDIVASPLAAATGDSRALTTGATLASGAKTTTDGAASYGNGDYSSDTEADKPFILEIGTRPITSTTNTTSSVPAIDFPNDYPLDMHLTASNSFVSIASVRQQHFACSEQQQPATLPPHLALYNHHLHLHQHQHLTTVTALKSMQTTSMANSAGFLPQTWSAMDAGRQATSEFVPAAFYMSYAGTSEHFVSKEPNPVWKEKALQIEKDYKKTACDRERTRMRDMNRAFDLLRSKLPISKPNGKKYSKIESLRIAINYINHLQQCLVEGSPEPEISNLSTKSSKSNRFHQFEQTTVDYFSEIDARRCRNTNPEIHYESNKHSNYQLDIDKDSDEQQRSSWSENSYAPNGNDWE